MPARYLQTLALALVTAVACRTSERGSAHDTSASRAHADTSLVTTQQMVEALTSDVHASDRELTAVEDSIYLFTGDSVSVLLKQARASWQQYRKMECDAIHAAFAQGTMAPVAQMECWIDITDDYRRFLAEQYGYMRIGRTPQPARTR